VQDERTQGFLYISTISIIGDMRTKGLAAVPALIDQLPKAIHKRTTLKDGRGVIASIGGALEKITGRHFGDNQSQWSNWLAAHPVAAPPAGKNGCGR
jgi:hypothetical protein